ncbi:hypothetical protein [Solilutibacter tolerans]|uniref:Lipoprotein n=2 Tax=Bacteria TaxID=2 RepID=A0A1N6PKD9_9GAMM|nr:hypothetical protein [Lysobacter tolerans]SIQ04825.1 hypothetical protein SAMN05421546_0649 [Lysobacter tolerans]
MRTLLLVVAMSLVACQSSGNGGNASTSSTTSALENHTLGTGQSVSLPDRSTLTYVRVVADSRCRPDVQCIRAGDADIEFKWTPVAGNPLTTALNSDPRNQQNAPNSARFGRWQVVLKGLDWEEPPRATLTISQAD